MKRGADPTVAIESLDRLRLVVEEIPEEVIQPLRDAALNRIGRRDPTDWPFVAAALALNCPVWTEDNDFFGTGIPNWTTASVEIYLRGD